MCQSRSHVGAMGLAFCTPTQLVTGLKEGHSLLATWAA